MAYLRSISEEYDDKGNYIGNSPEGNKFHGISQRRFSGYWCAGCHKISQNQPCTYCGCWEVQEAYENK